MKLLTHALLTSFLAGASPLLGARDIDAFNAARTLAPR